jgi:hypothetical protein
MRQVTRRLALVGLAALGLVATGCDNPNEPNLQLSSLSVSCQAATLSGPGQLTQCAAFATLSGAVQNITAGAEWSTSDPAVALVSRNGRVTSGSPGVVQITARFRFVNEEGLQDARGSATIRVLP